MYLIFWGRYKNKARLKNRALLKNKEQNYLVVVLVSVVLVVVDLAAGLASVLAAGLAAGLAVVVVVVLVSFLVVSVLAVPWALIANTAKATVIVKKIFFMAFLFLFWVN
jgi:uncharacterized membrane protein YkgB